MQKFTSLALMLCLIPFLSFAQQRDCGTMDHLEMLLEQDPQMSINMEAIEDHTRNFIENGTSSRAVVTIPVVVHVVYRTNSENISDAQVLSQIDVLNEDFRRTNGDANNKWSQAADTEIEFCMATVDPNGNATDGINRVQTGKRSFRTNDDVKKSSKGGVDAWDTSEYMNIWVCNLANGILGYAQFPGGSAATDGIVVLYNAFGRVGTLNSTYNLGRTTTHEVGHYLNLRHIWGDGGCSVDDFVSDTPASDGANYNCTYTESCGTEDMIENYMDYTNDACMNLFTNGQSSRMNATLVPGGFHYSLTQSTACSGGGTGPTPTCSDGIQNGDETGVDCGGSCDACVPTGGSCDAPTNLSYQSKQSGQRATLKWNSVAGANSYEIQIRQVGGTWTDGTSGGTSITFTGLTPGADYEWQVRSVCGSDVSDWSTHTFTAGISSRFGGLQDQVSLYPNPANDYITVEYAFENDGVLKAVATNDKVTVMVYDLYGKLINTTNVNDVDGGFEYDVSDMQNGMYLLRLEQDGQQIVKKFVVRK